MAVKWSIKPVSEADKERYRAIAAEMGRRYGVPYQVVVGVIQQESRFDPKSYRWNEENVRDRSFGLMHLVIPTAQAVADKIFGVGKVKVDQNYLYNAKNNIQLGTYYLKQQYEKYGKSWENAISAYNAGRPIQGNMMSYVAEVIKKGAAIPVAGKAILVSLVAGSVIAWMIYKRIGRK